MRQCAIVHERCATVLILFAYGISARDRSIVNKHVFRLSALCAAMLAANSAVAVGLGDIILHSRIGEPLRAEIPINAEGDENIDGACFSLAPLQGSDLPVISSGKIKIVRDNGRQRLVITGSKPIMEPVALIGIRAACGVSLQRDYVLMPAEPLSIASPAPTLATSPVASQGGRQLRANEGDTLESIAEGIAPDNLAQQRRLLAALKRANPQLKTKPALADGTLVTIPDVKQRVVAEREALPLQSTAEPPAEKPAATRAESKKPSPPPKKTGSDRLVLGSPTEALSPGDKRQLLQEDTTSRIQKLEATIQSLNTQIEALDRALALTKETLDLQQKLQSAQQAAALAAPPPPAPPQANSNPGNWMEILLSALLGGALAGGIAHLLGRRRTPAQHDGGFVPPGREATPAAPHTIFEPLPSGKPSNVIPLTRPTKPASPAPAVEVELTRPPESLQQVEVKYDQDESAIALAEIMLSFGRLQAATDTLARHVADTAPDNPRAWLMLLDLYRRGGLSREYNELCPLLRAKFNLQLPAWAELQNRGSGLKSLEDYPHVTARITTTWGTQDCMDYLYELVHDTREGQRTGFPLEVVEEIVLLLLALEDGYGLERRVKTA